MLKPSRVTVSRNVNTRILEDNKLRVSIGIINTLMRNGNRKAIYTMRLKSWRKLNKEMNYIEKTKHLMLCVLFIKLNKGTSMI